MKTLFAASLLATAAAIAAPAAARQLTIDDVTTLSRVGAPTASADGRWLVWAQRETDLAANRGRYDLWRLDLTRKGAKPEPLVAEAEVNENAPQIVGSTVYFQSNKGGEDAIWAVPVTGGTPRTRSARRAQRPGYQGRDRRSEAEA
jgi:dipeptidyl aminopeptidase/acylaminoacyl peptidase